MRLATAADGARLVELMAEFYAEAGYELNRAEAGRVFGTLLADERLGYVWLIEAPDGQVAGHLVLTLCFSMEYGGLKAFLDDFFVRHPYRNAGLGTAALRELRTFCEQQDIRAVSVEVGQVNDTAQTVYRRVGFADIPDRQLLTMTLAERL